MDTLNRLAGRIMITGAALSVVGYVISSVGPSDAKPTPAVVDSTTYRVGNILVFLGAALVLLAIPAMIARQYERSRKLTLIGGAGLALVEVVQGVANTFGNVTLFPMLVDNPATLPAAQGNPPAILGVFFVLSLIGSVVGGIVFAIAVLRAKVYPMWVGIVMLLAAVAGPVSGSGPAFVQNAAAILGSVALLGVGYRLASRTLAAVAVTTPAAAQAA